MAADNVTHAKDMGWFFMQTIAKGGNAYLNRTLMQTNFHGHGFPMSAKGMNAVEFRLTEIKDNVKDYVKGYMRPSCQLDLHRYPVKHYTHITIASTDFPWHAEETAKKNAEIANIMAGRTAGTPEEEDFEMDLGGSWSE